MITQFITLLLFINFLFFDKSMATTSFWQKFYLTIYKKLLSYK